MTELKTWRSDSAFNKELTIPFCSCDMNGKMHLAQLLAITSDLAVEDFEDRKLDYIMLKEHGFAILLSRISYKIEKMPLEAQKITVKTWEEKAQGLQMVRKFEICDSQSNEILIFGTTMWLLVDPNARRILPPAKFDLRPVPEISTELKTLEPGKIKLGENAFLVEKRKMQFSDCDPNGHVNNSRYGAFAIDAVMGNEQLCAKVEGKLLSDFRLNYAKEAHLGDELEILAEEKECDGKICICVEGKNASEISFESELYFC